MTEISLLMWAFTYQIAIQVMKGERGKKDEVIERDGHDNGDRGQDVAPLPSERASVSSVQWSRSRGGGVV